MSAQKILIGTLSGIAAGVVIGLLVAPDKGSETRAKIADTASSLKKKLQKLRGHTMDELDELKDVFEHEVSGLKDDVRERVLNLINASKAAGNNVGNNVKNQVLS